MERKEKERNEEEKQELKKNDFALKVGKAKVIGLNNDISKYAKQKDLGRAIECFETALSNNWANSHTYAAIINAYVRCGEIEEASKVYETLKTRPNGVRLDVISCTTLMKGYCSQGDLIHAKRILNDMFTISPKIIPNIRTINTFLRGCVLVGALKDAEEIFPRIQHEFNLTPDISSWEYLVILLSQGLLLDKVFPIIGRLRNEKSIAGGVASMCVNVSRAAAILCETKTSRRYLTLATQLLQDDEEFQLELNLNSNSTTTTTTTTTTTNDLNEEKGKNNQKQTIGGKQAWRVDSEDARVQSLEVYKEHRRAELRQEIECITSFLGKLNITIENIIPYFKRILLFNQYDESITVEGINLPDCFISSLISTLGFIKVLMKKNQSNGIETTTDFPIYRNIIVNKTIENNDNNNTNNKKKKGKDKKKDRNKKILKNKNSSNHNIVLPISVAEGLNELRNYYENCLDINGKLKLNHFFGEDRIDLPLKLEICSGFGEWAVKQAFTDLQTGNWLTLELRQDRVYQTFTRSIFEGTSNLAILGGDAINIIENYFPDGILSNIFVNYPEPPQQIGGNETQSKHLLNENFFSDINRILKVDGILTILTDNLWYGKLLLKIISTNSHLRFLMNVEVNCLIQETLRGFTLYCGKPGIECGHLIETSSYFDRLWQRGRQPDRYFIVLKKSNQQGSLNLNLSLSRGGKKHALERVYSGVSKKIKFDDNEEDNNE